MLNATGLTNLANDMRSKLPARSDSATHRGNLGDEVANVAQLRTAGFDVARLAPFYGKFNLTSEVRIHFQAYDMAGLSGALFHHESVNLCGSANLTACGGGYLTSDALRPAAQLGAGFR